jgi:hypothetical protein
VTIYYFPHPSAPPATTDVAYKIGDYYNNQNNSLTVLTGGSGLSAGRKLWSKYSAASPVIPQPAPNIIASTLISNTTGSVGQSLSFTPVQAYGGFGVVGNPPLNVNISPSLPAGLTFTTSKTNIEVSSFISKTGSAGNFSVTLGFSATTAPIVGQTYRVLGNSREVYNGHYVCTAATATSITLRYPHDPGVWGTGQTVIQDDTTKAIVDSDGVLKLFNYVEFTVSGTPTEPLTSRNYVVTFSDAAGQTATATFNLTVGGGPVALDTSLSIASRTVTQNIAITPFTPVTATGGQTPLTYSISPTLPTGLSLNSSTGQISGTATISSVDTAYQITVTDATGSTSSKTFNLTVEAPAVITTVAVSSRTVIQGVLVTPFTPITATGGIPPLTYSINPELPNGLSFNTSTGQITGTASQPVTQKTYTVTVSDSNSPSQNSSKTFTLTVDPLPSLISTVLTPASSFTKNTAITSFTPVSASGGYLTLTYSISPVLPAGLNFNTSTGQITGTPTEVSNSTEYTVTITDQANQITFKSFTLEVGPAVLTTALVISSRTVIQNSVIIPFTPVIATGGEGVLLYNISPSLPAGLNFNSATGQITGAPSVISGSVSYEITVTDQLSQSSSKSFSLAVDPPPLLLTTTIGQQTLVQFESTSFTPVTVVGGFGTLTYSINPSLPQGLNFNTGTGLITGTPAVFLTTTSFTVTVTDLASQSSNQSFSLTINTPPLLAQQSVVARTLIRTVPITAFTPVTAVGGTGNYTYSITPTVPNGLLFNSSTGQITGTATVLLSETTFTVNIEDTLNQTASNTFKLTVEDPPIITTAVQIASATFSRFEDTVNISPVSASGGFGTISFAISPALPQGLSFSSTNGRITGIPTALVNQIYTITATDSIGQASSKTFELIVINPPVVVTQAVASTTVTRSKQISAFTPVTASSGISPLTFGISPALPAGLVLNVLTGEITGTPSESIVSTTFTITVTDSVGSSDSETFTLTVEDPPALTTTLDISEVSIVIDEFVTPFKPVSATGGDGNLVYTISPALPFNLIIEPSTGVISGRPRSLINAVNFTVTVTDSLNQTSSKTFSLTVEPKPLVSTVILPNLTLTLYTSIAPVIPVTATGGTGTLSYSVNPSLPSGLFFNDDTGEITGTPTQIVSTTSFTVTATDQNLETTSASFNLTVEETAPPELTVSAQNISFSLDINAETEFQPVLAVGGFGDYVYSISPSELPAGLNFNTSTGLITGIPNTLTVSTLYTVTVTDAVPQIASASFSLSVIQPVVTSGKGYTGSRGYTGSQGFTGSRGFTGSKGDQGDIGFTGSIGYTGSRGDTGFVGSRGDLGYTGSQGDIGYTGSIGFTGSQGVAGELGYTGSRGDTGFTGSIGFTGSRGADGELGYTGSRGDTGFTGSAGAGFTGSRGDTGFTGSIGEQGPLGYTGSAGTSIVLKGAVATVSDLNNILNPSVGDFYVVSSTGDGYVWDGTNWVNTGQIQGPAGFTGSQGIIGFTGSAGTGNLVFTVDGDRRILTGYIDNNEEVPVRTAELTSGAFILNLAAFTPVLESNPLPLAMLNWDVACTGFTVLVENPTDFLTRYISSVESLNQLSGNVYLIVDDYTTTGPSPTPAAGVSWNQTFNTNSTAYIRSASTTIQGGVASAEVNFNVTETDDLTETLYTTSKAIWSVVWNTPTVAINMTNLTGNTFLRSYLQTNYNITVTGIFNPSVYSLAVTPTGGTVTNVSGNGQIIFSQPVHKNNTNQSIAVSVTSTFTRPLAVTGLEYTAELTAQDNSISFTFTYPSIWLFTDSVNNPPLRTNIVSNDNFTVGVTVLGNQTKNFSAFVNNTETVPQVFWFGVRASVTQPTVFQTGASASLLSDVVFVTNSVNLAPDNPAVDYIPEPYTLYGIILQPGNTYVNIS